MNPFKTLLNIIGIGVLSTLVAVGQTAAPRQVVGAAADVAANVKRPKTFMDYFLPTPIHGKLTRDGWGADNVLPRDVENGLEDTTMKQYCYWDGQIIKAPDGKYHMFASRWDQAKGHNGWFDSIAIRAVSDSLTGPYVDKGPIWPADQGGKGHNVTALALPDGRYAIVISETRPCEVYVSQSLDGPFEHLGTITVEGEPRWHGTNVAIMVRPDGKFQITQRDGRILISDKGILGPYKSQGDSVFPKNIPNLEDPCIWYSGGLYHIVVNSWSTRQAYHFTSIDGIKGWINRGVAYDPRAAIVRYSDGTVNHWDKLERPGIYIENGHVAAVTLASIDVEKDQEKGNDNHGSKVLVLPFDGVAFDRDLPILAKEESPRRWGDWQRWGDQGDGTYINPVLPADYSDIDCIRVGSNYYAISSTFQYSPGMVILQSKDLVNWKILGHAVNDLTQIGPELNWNRMNRYGRGIWAGALRYHAKKFWLYFGTPEEGYFMTSAPRAEGPWEPLHQVLSESGWDDCCPFWDDDGQGYFVGTQFKQNYKTYIYKMTPDGRDIIKSSAVLINEGRGREANKLYKWNGWYYHFFSEVGGDGGRYTMMQRARNIFGPYSEKKQLTHTNREAHEPNQGGIIQTPQGGWYFLTHHGNGDWSGRVMSLLPVTWIDGWPIIGKVAQDGIGDMAWSGRKPIQRTPIVLPQTDDAFKGKKLLPQWEWNYQPRPEKWSLNARRGWLRLNAFAPLQRGNLLKAGNTLTQRVFRSNGVATVKLDISQMADGQAAGLCQYGGRYAWLGVTQEGGVRYLTYNFNGTATRGPALSGALVWLQTSISTDGYATWAYSIDGHTFTPSGERYGLEWVNYRGSRLGIFTYNDDGEAGFVDVDEFQYDFDGPHRSIETSKPKVARD